MNYLKLVVVYLLEFIRLFLSYLIPKKENYLVFIPLHKTNKWVGNPRALAEYIQENHKEYSIAIISFSPEVIQKESDFKVKYKYLEVVWTLLRAKHILIDSHTLFLKYGINFEYGNYSVIQLWHGSGFKNVGLLNENILTHKKHLKKAKRVSNYKLVLATSECNRIQQNESFGVTTSKITGYPRNDFLFRNTKLKENIKRKWGLESYNEIITYAPTFRDRQTRNPFSEKTWEDLQNYLSEQNSALIVNLHPKESFLQIPTHFSNIINLTNIIQDVQELLLISDKLITDYSSISTDFAVTNKPILIYAYDFEEYTLNCRGFYYNLSETLPLPIIKEEKELLETLKDDKWYLEEENKKSYQKFVNTFHHYLDGNSSKRTMEEIIKLG